MREKREEVNRQILKEEEKAKIQKDLSILAGRLSKINESLSRKNQKQNEYDKTIQKQKLPTENFGKFTNIITCT